MKLLKILVIFALSICSYSSQRAVTGPNQGMIVYCDGTGCTAYGSKVLDLSNDTNWTLLIRFAFDASLGNGAAHDLFSQTTLIGGTFTCAGMYIREPGPGFNAPLNVNITVDGGIGSFVLFSGSTNIGRGPWYAIAVTHDTSHNWKLWVDGVLDGSITSTPSMDTGCNTFIATVAGATDCGGGETGCWFNDVALYNVVLPDNDIKGFAKGTRPNLLSTNPLAFYAMDGAVPSPCAPLSSGYLDPDSSGNQHSLELGFDPAPDYCASSASGQTNGNVMNPSGEATR